VEFVDLENDAPEDVGGVDLVFDVIGGDIQKRSARVIRAGGTLVQLCRLVPPSVTSSRRRVSNE
jgi:NADPH:quinone reductase-like Zn-dependent oxidoreductase